MIIMKEIKICPVCKQQFESKRSTMIYCSSTCRYKAAERKRKDLDPTKERTKTCLKCGQEFVPKKNGWTRAYCFNCVPETIYKRNGSEMRKIIKQWAIDYKGNKCQCCGYDTCLEALEFHHLDKTQKDFNISDRNLKTSDWPLIKSELDKCILVCANCHREIHSGYRTFIKE